jgi:lauroyl/myristoyl acyltransferase
MEIKRGWYDFLRRTSLENRLFWSRQGVLPMNQRLKEKKLREVLRNRLSISPSKVSQVLRADRQRSLRGLNWDSKSLLTPRKRENAFPEPMIRIEGLDHFVAARKHGRGVVLAGLHMGEYACLWSSAFLRRLREETNQRDVPVNKLNVVMQVGSQPELAETIARDRDHCSKIEVLDAQDPSNFLKALHRLKNGAVFAGMLDIVQPGNMPGGTLPVRFLETEFSAPKGLFWATVKSGADMLPWTFRREKGEIVVHIHPPLKWNTSGEIKDQIQELGNLFYQQAESEIRTAPLLWDRWATLPIRMIRFEGPGKRIFENRRKEALLTAKWAIDLVSAVNPALGEIMLGWLVGGIRYQKTA